MSGLSLEMRTEIGEATMELRELIYAKLKATEEDARILDLLISGAFISGTRKGMADAVEIVGAKA